jgi:hypothetical protein
MQLSLDAQAFEELKFFRVTKRVAQYRIDKALADHWDTRSNKIFSYIAIGAQYGLQSQ